MEFNTFCEAINQEILANSEDEDSPLFREEKFAAIASEYMSEAGVAIGFEPAAHESKAGKLTGYSFFGDGEFLDLYTAVYNGGKSHAKVSNMEVEKRLKMLMDFLESSLKGKYKELEESSVAFSVAHRIHEEKQDISKVRLFAVVNGIMEKRIDRGIKLNGFECELKSFDMKLFCEMAKGGGHQDQCVIDIKNDFGCNVPLVRIDSASKEYECYLCSFPGDLLVKIYGKYGPSLLEKNVRSFLQVRGKVNKGIRETIINQPQRFLAYNNGIATVADKVTVAENSKGEKILSKLHNLQIVNGGQTTASLYHAVHNDNADMSDVFVQVKITVVKNESLVDEFVPKISQFANSQNKVNVADFSANSLYHKNVEELSMNVWTPALKKNGVKTRWFYERVRGQYAEARSRIPSSRQKGFDASYPPDQKYSKTELAKYIMAWEQLPHHVCKGAEINFQEFTIRMNDNWKPKIDEIYFKRLVAKALLFRSIDSIVAKEEFGGYKSQITAYTVSLVSHLTAQTLDLESIWDAQTLLKGIDSEIAKVSRFVHKQITKPPNGRNISEWCKRLECWESIEKKADEHGFNFKKWTRGKTNTEHSATNIAPSSKDEKGSLSDVELKEIMEIALVKSERWKEIASWAKQTGSLLPWQRALSYSLGKLAEKEKKPSPKQAHQGLIILEKAKELGFH